MSRRIGTIYTNVFSNDPQLIEARARQLVQHHGSYKHALMTAKLIRDDFVKGSEGRVYWQQVMLAIGGLHAAAREAENRKK